MKGAAGSTGPDDVSTTGANGVSDEERNEVPAACRGKQQELALARPGRSNPWGLSGWFHGDAV